MTTSRPRLLPFAIRSAQLEDAEDIALCLAELGYGTRPDLVVEKLGAIVASRADAVFVAADVASGTVIGVASVHVLPLFHAPGELARLTALAVRHPAQGHGVGRELLARVEAFAWAEGCRRIEVTSGDHRPGAHAFYKAAGYHEDERRFIKSAPEHPSD